MALRTEAPSSTDEYTTTGTVGYDATIASSVCRPRSTGGSSASTTQSGAAGGDERVTIDAVPAFREHRQVGQRQRPVGFGAGTRIRVEYDDGRAAVHRCGLPGCGPLDVDEPVTPATLLSIGAIAGVSWSSKR